MIPRPEKSEAAEYYFRYIDLVPGGDAGVVLSSQLDEAAALFSSIGEDRSGFRYAPEKWSIRQLLSHISDTERALAFRLLFFSRGFDVPLPGFDQDISVAAAEADGVPFAAHIEDFRRVRLATLSLVANLPSVAWMRSGIANQNRVSVRALAYIIAGHCAHHLQVLRERYLSGAGPGR